MARHNQVTVLTPFTLAGAMAPVTIAGAVAQQNAEALAGLCLAQTVRPGSPFVYWTLRGARPIWWLAELCAVAGGDDARAWRRRNLERYVAIVNQRAAGLPVSVFISIKLERQKEADLQRFARAISGWSEVLECYLMTGHRDYLLRVVVAYLAAYEQFLTKKLTRVEGIASIESSFALDQIKYSIALPV